MQINVGYYQFLMSIVLFSFRQKFVADSELCTTATFLTQRTVDTIYMEADDMVWFSSVHAYLNIKLNITHNITVLMLL